MLCRTCNTPSGEVDMSTSDKKPPTWVCANGHRQPWGDDEPVRMTGLRPARPALSVEQDALAEAAIVLEALHASVKWELAPAMKEQIAVAVLKVRKALGVAK